LPLTLRRAAGRGENYQDHVMPSHQDGGEAWYRPGVAPRRRGRPARRAFIA